MNGLIGAKKSISSGVTVGLANFREEVLDVGPDEVVVLDFWAPWCGPCKQLDSLLNRVIEGFKGAVKLAKINVDQEPQLAAQFRVQSVPTVIIFKQGQPVDGFQGLVSETALRQVIERHVDQTATRQVEAIIEAAHRAFYRGDVGQALGLYAALLQQDPQHMVGRVGYARCLLLSGELQKAEGLITSFTTDEQKHPEVAGLKVWAQLLAKGQELGDIKVLKASTEADPHNLAARFAFAQGLFAQGALSSALHLVLEILKTKIDAEENTVKAYLLQCFEALGAAHPLVIESRKDFSKLMFK